MSALPQPFDRSTSGVVPFWPWMISISPLPPACLAIQSQTWRAEFDAVCSDEGVAGRAFCVAVDVDDRNAGSLCRLDRHRRGSGAGGDVDQRVDVLREQILDLAHLRRRVAFGVDGDHLDAFLGAGGLDRLLDLIEEVRLKVGDRKADLLCVLRIRPERCEQRDRSDRGEQRQFPNTHLSLSLFVPARREFFAVSFCQLVHLDLDPLLVRSVTDRVGEPTEASSRIPRGASLSLSVAHRVRRHRDRDHDADNDLLNERRDLQQIEAVAQEADDQDADGGAADASDAARQACASDDDGRDRVELVAQA